jgi:hypothetical protein
MTPRTAVTRQRIESPDEWRCRSAAISARSVPKVPFGNPPERGSASRSPVDAGKQDKRGSGTTAGRTEVGLITRLSLKPSKTTSWWWSLAGRGRASGPSSLDSDTWSDEGLSPSSKDTAPEGEVGNSLGLRLGGTLQR